MIAVLLLAQLARAVPDTARFPPREEVLRLYTNCDESRWPYGLVERLVPKTREELETGVARRRALEEGWRRWFAARAGDSIAPTPADRWIYPLPIRGRLLNNYANPRAGGPHEALDVFVPREGVVVRSPVAGVVVAAGDGWQGGWKRRGGLQYGGGGLSRRAGNGVVIFDPAGGAYLYLAHLQGGSVSVQAGDVVRAGQAVGRVGHSGNASAPGHGRHLHVAWKQAGTACDVAGVLVSANPYQRLRAARDRLTRGRSGS